MDIDEGGFEANDDNFADNISNMEIDELSRVPNTESIDLAEFHEDRGWVPKDYVKKSILYIVCRFLIYCSYIFHILLRWW